MLKAKLHDRKLPQWVAQHYKLIGLIRSGVSVLASAPGGLRKGHRLSLPDRIQPIRGSNSLNARPTRQAGPRN